MNWESAMRLGMIQNRRMAVDDPPVLEGRLNIVTGETGIVFTGPCHEIFYFRFIKDEYCS